MSSHMIHDCQQKGNSIIATYGSKGSSSKTTGEVTSYGKLISWDKDRVIFYEGQQTTSKYIWEPHAPQNKRRL